MIFLPIDCHCCCKRGSVLIVCMSGRKMIGEIGIQIVTSALLNPDAIGQ